MSDKVKKEIFEWITSIFWAIILALLINKFIMNTTYVKGSSMFPTLYEKDRLFSQKVTLYFKGPKRGDIVVIEAPDRENTDYIKRVIGLEGDLVSIENGKVYLNGEKIKENYINKALYTEAYGESEWKVPKGEIFVLGDNREPGASKDSRYFGTVDVDSVKGIANFRYFPFNNRFGILK